MPITFGTRFGSSGKILNAFREENPKTYLLVYATFLLVVGWICHHLWEDIEFSSVLTWGAVCQCISFSMLLLKMQTERSVSGISAKTLLLQAMAFPCRLISTLFMDGYLPVDKTGDWAYQFAEIVALIINIQILMLIFGKYRHSYQKEYDDFVISFVTIGCVLLAIFVHPTLNGYDYPIYDVCWTIAMHLEVIAMVPQLWMMSRIGEKVESMTGHYVSFFVLGRALQLLFWYYGYSEIEEIGQGYQIIICYSLSLLISCDFMYYYLKARLSGSALMEDLDLPLCVSV